MPHVKYVIERFGLGEEHGRALEGIMASGIGRDCQRPLEEMGLVEKCQGKEGRDYRVTDPEFAWKIVMVLEKKHKSFG